MFAAAAFLGGSFALWGVGPEALRGGDEQRPRPGGELPSPVVDTHHLMELFNQELYKLLKQEMQREPADSEAWKTIRNRGLQAAEVANLVAIRDRAEGDNRWQRLSGGVQRAGIGLAEAAKAENFERTRQAYRQLIESCNACHQTMAPEHAPTLEP